jgi:hypothetical protein
MGVSYDGGGGGGPVNKDIPYVAGDFGATGAMTWTVDAADVHTFSYSLDGKMLTLTFLLANTTVGGVVAGANLTIKLPNGLLAAQETAQPCLVAPGGGATEGGIAFILAGSNLLTILRYAAAWIVGVNNTDVNGVCIIKVQ